MKRAFVLLLVLAISLQGFCTAPLNDGEEKLSPFVGKWDWAWNDNVHKFYIWCGERNDSLLFAMGGVFFKVTDAICPSTAKMMDSSRWLESRSARGTLQGVK